MSLLFWAVFRQTYRASSSSNVNPHNTTEMKRNTFTCILWAPSPADFSLTREEKILSGVTWPINMYTTIPGAGFVAMMCEERLQTSNFSSVTGWHNFDFPFPLLPGCTKVRDVVLVQADVQAFLSIAIAEEHDFPVLPLYTCVNGPFLAFITCQWKGPVSVCGGTVYHVESQQTEIWTNSLEFREFIGRKLCESNT